MSGQDELFTKQALYCFDTSSLIQLRIYYPQDLFPDINNAIYTRIVSGEIIICDLVLEELKDKEKTMHKSITDNLPKSRRASFADHIIETQRIVQTYYDQLNKSYAIKADPLVIACAKTTNTTVVTEEANSDPSRIPRICDREGIKCINIVDFYRNCKFSS